MADPIGLALGFAGLVGLFTACVDSFKLVQIYRQRKDDYDVFQTMLDNQQFHLMAWGQACGFMGTEQPDIKGKFDDPLSAIRNAQIQHTMLAIRSLLTDGHQLKAKYGLKREMPVAFRNIQDAMTPPSAFERVFQGTARFWNTSLQRKSRIKGAILWTISDKEKFESLVDQLRNLIADLSQLTETYGVAQSQLWVVRYEMEKIEDEASLEVITQVNSSSPGDDLVSLAATRQLSLVRDRSVAVGQGRTIDQEWDPIRPDDSISLFKKPAISHVQELDEELDIGPQPLEITRVLPSQWRNVKTRQGLFPWLGVLIVCTSTASGRPVVPVVPVAVPDPPVTKESRGSDPLSYIRRAITSNDKVPADFTQSTSYPSRVAINSRTLLAVLAKITGARIPESKNVLIYSFKYIVLHADRIRKVYKSVCQECEDSEYQNMPRENIKDPNPGPKSPDLGRYTDTLVDSNSDEDLLRDISRVKAELQCLIEFMDVDLANLFHTKEGVESGRILDLAFEHLWFYFLPGTRIVTEREDLDESQCLLILHVTGGRLIVDENSQDPKTTSPLPGDIHAQAEFHESNSFMTPFIIDCLFLDFDGQHIGPRPRRIIIPPYRGVRQWDTFAVNYGPEGSMEKLAARGRKFLSTVHGQAGQVGHFTFSGISNTELEPDHLHTCRYCATTNTQETVEGSVIVDHGAAIRHYRAQSCTFEVQFGRGVVARPTKSDPREVFDPLNRDSSTGLRSTDIFDDSYIELKRREVWKAYITALWRLDQIIFDPPSPDGDTISSLLPPHLLAFSLTNRQWYALPVNKLASIPPEPQHPLWDDLILPPEHKDLVLGLVSVLGVTRSGGEMHHKAVHKAQPERPFISSQVQRRCLIVLLHGPPGTGKTLLVEGVAEYLRRPVFTINCGALGSAERGATAKLATWFDLAKRWRCVLLLKEVDAFLEQREQDGQADRVEIRSVLLQLLQTFDGVTFLSTNRVGILDSAFLSHVNLRLYFPRLDFEQKMRVWQIFERRAGTDFSLEVEDGHGPDTDPRHFELLDSKLGGFVRSLFHQHPEMNGREIRNMWQTAMSLALYEYQKGEEGHQENTSSKPRLTAKHFSTITMSMAQFRGYMAVVGATERDIDSEIRVDDSEFIGGNPSQGRS